MAKTRRRKTMHIRINDALNDCVFHRRLWWCAHNIDRSLLSFITISISQRKHERNRATAARREAIGTTRKILIDRMYCDRCRCQQWSRPTTTVVLQFIKCEMRGFYWHRYDFVIKISIKMRCGRDKSVDAHKNFTLSSDVLLLLTKRNSEFLHGINYVMWKCAQLQVRQSSPPSSQHIYIYIVWSWRTRDVLSTVLCASENCIS